MSRECCQRIKYLGDSYLQDSHKGQCLFCGSIRHGHKSNWRIVHDAEHGFMMQAKPETSARGPSYKPLTRTKKPAPVIEVSQIRGMSMEAIVSMLKDQGIVLP